MCVRTCLCFVYSSLHFDSSCVCDVSHYDAWFRVPVCLCVAQSAHQALPQRAPVDYMVYSTGVCVCVCVCACVCEPGLVACCAVIILAIKEYSQCGLNMH